MVCLLLGNAVAEALRVQAPRASVFFCDITPDLTDQLNAGAVDLAIVNLDYSSWGQTSSQYFYSDHSAGVVRSDHPLAAMDKPDLQSFLAYPHLRWRGQIQQPASASAPTFVRASLYVRHFSALPLLVTQSDAVAVAPRRFLDWIAQRLPLKVFDLPYPTRELRMSQIWSPVYEADPAHRWLRQMVRAALPGPG
jgi:DNA-binding transcriptional LysR family regulator